MKAKAKKILFLSAWYPTRLDPMPGLFVKRHAETLTNSYQVAALHAIQTNNKLSSYEIEKIKDNQILTIIVYYPKAVNSIPIIQHLIKIWHFIRAYAIGVKEIRKDFGLPDIVHVNILTRIGAIALYLKFRYSIPYVITEHWSRYLPERNDYKGVFRKLATKVIVHYSSGISTVTKKLKQALIDNGINHEKFLIVRNVVDTNLLTPSNTKQNDAKTLVFAHISCFDNMAKNTNGIVKAIATLSKQRKDFLCLMVGDGPDKLEAEYIATQLGINKNALQFTGLLEGKGIIEIYNQSLFTVLFSNYETMSVVISESFSCGKPIIATNVGGIPEIVDESMGILIPPGNEEKLVSAINYMLDNYSNFDATLIRNYAIAQFGKEAVYKQLENLYESVRQ